jgi:hypothetical protein
MKQVLRQHKIVFVILLILVIFLFYPFTIFFRGTIVPFYVNTFYRGSVKAAYTDTFTDLNKQLGNLGFVLSTKPPTCYNGVSDNGNAWFHYIAETVPCMQEAESQPLAVTDSFKSQWSAKSPKINASLLANGWVEGGNFGSDTRLTDLYKAFDPIYYHQTAYAKSFGKYKCDLQIQYANSSGEPGSSNNTKAYVRESCTRNVSFFGGYID